MSLSSSSPYYCSTYPNYSDITTINITTATSDVTMPWIVGNASAEYWPTNTSTDLSSGSTSNTGTYSWDLGQYVINAPTATTACANNATGLASCSMFTDVAGWTASDDPNFYKNNNGSPVNTSTKTYDAHYLVGNYYQWNAATAGTGGTIKNENAAGSICPKGWKLPGSAIDANTITKGTYAYLLQQYGLATAYNTGTITGSSSVSGSDGTLNTYNIALSPLFLVRAGEVSLYYPSEPFRYAGSTGTYWSSRAISSATGAYTLYFNTSVYPSLNYDRFYGHSLRCLIPTP